MAPCTELDTGSMSCNSSQSLNNVNDCCSSQSIPLSPHSMQRSTSPASEMKLSDILQSNQNVELKSPHASDNGFVFPFFHLDSSNFEFRQYHFPFSCLGPSIFGEHGRPAPRKNNKLGSPLNKLMRMVGLEDVKKEFLSIKDRVQAAQAAKKKVSVRNLNLDLIITGNPGTGKSTIAWLYAKYLQFLGVVRTGRFISMFGKNKRRAFTYISSSDDDSSTDEDEIIDEALIMDGDISLHRLDSDRNVLIVVGRKEEFKSILEHPKARERFSRRIDIKDYSEEELLTALINILKRDSVKVEGGFDAPFLRMFIRKIGYLKGQKQFENMNTLQTEIEKVCRRRAERLEKATLEKETVITSITYRSHHLIESDFFGLRPTDFYKTSEPWKKLEKMAGLDNVKEAVKELVLRRNINYLREREGKQPLKTSFNYVFLGPPGTGKTTVASLFGQIIADLGYIESNEVVIKKPTDFLGEYVGHSEAQTRNILGDTKGKVLIIDEAHMFYHGSEYGTDKSDIFRKGIVDTIVAHVDNEPGNGRCIILMGYPDRMKEFYRNTNPGFQRRFPLEDAFEFDDYDDKTLGHILDLMLAQDDIAATDDAKVVAMEVLRRERDRPNFGNGGAVRNLVSRAQVRNSKRIKSLAKKSQNLEDEKSKVLLEPQDFDPEYDRGLRINENFSFLFDNMVGFQDIIEAFQGYKMMTANMRQHGLDPRDQVPFSFVFKGAPGTGKTTTARALGQIYFSMGFLSTTEVIDCSVTDLVGPGQGLTGPKVQKLLDKAIGKVLLIDEAYRLGQKNGSGVFFSGFAQEAVGELVDCMTKERYAHKLVIVLAGYERDMNKLMGTNEGLRGRFTEMVFPNMKPEDCLRLLQKKLDEKHIKISRPRREQVQDNVIKLFKILSKTEAWANARDVESISKRLIRLVFMKELPVGGPVEVTLEEAVEVLEQVYRERITTTE